MTSQVVADDSYNHNTEGFPPNGVQKNVHITKAQWQNVIFEKSGQEAREKRTFETALQTNVLFDSGDEKMEARNSERKNSQSEPT